MAYASHMGPPSSNHLPLQQQQQQQRRQLWRWRQLSHSLLQGCQLALVLAIALAPTAQSGDSFAPRKLLSSPSSFLESNAAIAIPTVAVSCLVLIVAAIFIARRCLCSSSSSAAKPSSPSKLANGGGSRRLYARVEDSNVKAMRLNDIQVATNNFAADMVIEDKGYGVVYRAEGPNGEAWAVKRAKQATLEGAHLFRNEVDFLSQISHDNIVPLVASCDESEEQILVFELAANGSLRQHLRPTGVEPTNPPLTLAQRLDIALGIAEALRYLHSFTKPTIIHRDVKSDTVLLDDKFKVKLGGLGLLKHLPGEAMRHRMTKKKAYLDPEFFQTFKVTTKCDVFSFGVILLELITGKAPLVDIENSEVEGNSEAVLVPLWQWATPLIEAGKVESIVDPSLGTDYSKETVLAMAKIGASCVAPLRKDRPDMSRIAFLLAELKRPRASPSFNVSRFNSSGHKVVPI